MIGWSTMTASRVRVRRFRLWWVQSCYDKDDDQQEKDIACLIVFLLADCAGSFVLQVFVERVS